MKDLFDFNRPIDRKNSDSIKWRKYEGRDIIPMWVADMDFLSPPAVMAALHQRIDHGVFGYAKPSDCLKEIVVAHLQTTYQWRIDPEWIVWLPGLVTGLNVTCRSIGPKGTGILTSVPVYPPFLTAPKLSGKKLSVSEMFFSDHRWQIDLDDIQKVREPRTALFLLCNPHNPTGRIFTKNELEALAEICLRHRWLICSDEIHCDLLLEPGQSHTPIASLDPQISTRTITLMAPSKTYNIPGLSCAFAIIANNRLRRRFIQSMAGIVPHVNLLGFVAAQAAYEHGQPWLKALLTYLRSNRELVYRAVAEMPVLSMGPIEATYLAWIDVRSSGIENPALFFENAGVGLSDGADFGAPGFMRLNFGCSRQLLTEALARISRGLLDRRPGPPVD